MQLTLTVTPTHALPEEKLRAFVDKALLGGRDPNAVLADLICSFADGDAPKPRRTRKRKEVAA